MTEPSQSSIESMQVSSHFENDSSQNEMASHLKRRRNEVLFGHIV